MSLDAMIYIPRFIKIGSGIQKLMEEGRFIDSMDIATTAAFTGNQKLVVHPVSFFASQSCVCWYRLCHNKAVTFHWLTRFHVS
jgi:hypothetical protein